MQWEAWSPNVLDPCGVERNCCRECNPGYCVTGGDPPIAGRKRPANDGQAFPLQDPRIAVRPHFQSKADKLVHWLQLRVPDRFWKLTIEYWRDTNEHPDMDRLRELMMVSAKKPYLKILSYCGAVRVPEQFLYLVGDEFVTWRDDDGTCYIDVTNRVYSIMFRCTWPNVLTVFGLSNEESIGDCVEALLGYAWLCRRQRLVGRADPLPNLAHEIISAIEAACFAFWVLDTIG